MQLLVYLIVYPLLWCISKLPFKILYLLSDVLYFFLYTVSGYRKRIVLDNLKLVFPNTSKKERKILASAFYKHFCDLIFEAIKSLTIKRKDIDQRFVFKNLDKIEALERKNKSIILMTSHYANWEWSIAIQNHIGHEGYAIYKKLRNKHFDKLVRRIRARYNAFLITTKETIPTLKRLKKEGKLFIAGFAADQSPKKYKAHYWREFLGVKVPVVTGPEMIANTLDVPAVFFRIDKTKRGYYEATIEDVIEYPKELKEFELTDRFMDYVEKQIYEKPEYYLWTHKRWKHKDHVPEKFK